MSWLIKWFKKDLPKSSGTGSVTSVTTGSNYIMNGTINNTLGRLYPTNSSAYVSFASYMEESIKAEKARIEEAKLEIAKFEPVTQQILKDLEDAGLISHYAMSNLVPTTELQALALGKVIDVQVKNALFTKKLEDTINE